MIFHGLVVSRALFVVAATCCDRGTNPAADGAADDGTIASSEFVPDCRASGSTKSPADGRIEGRVVRMSDGGAQRKA